MSKQATPFAKDGEDKQWTGFDLDGTLAKYDAWKGYQHIGEPIAPMVALLKKLHAGGKRVKILTARVAPTSTDPKKEGGGTPERVRGVIEKLFYQVLDAKDYGIPQKRRRLFVVGFKDKTVDFSFPTPIKLTKTLFDYLEPNVSFDHYLGEKGFAFVTDPSHPNRTHVNCEIAKTQKANQQFNWNGDFIFEPLGRKHSAKIRERAFVGEWHGKRGVARKLTNRECLRLMGFPDTFKIVVPPVQAYRQSGNSIVVNVLERIVEKILEVI